MLLQVRNFELVKDREKTYLTAPVSVADTTLTVKAVDSNAWADNDWVIVGEIGSKNAEILQVNGAVSDGTSLTIDNAGSGGARYAHSIDEPVYRINYNQVEFNRSATDSTSGVSVLTTAEIQPDDIFTRYEDVSNTTGYGFVRFKNSFTSSFSEYSDGIPYTGYGKLSLGRMLRRVRKLLGEENFKYIEDEDIIDEINEKQRDIAHERLWPFYEDIFSDSTVAYQREYGLNSGCVIGKDHTLTVESWPIAKIDAGRFDQLYWSTSTTGTPTHASVWNNKLRFYPIPASAATTTTLDGAVSSTTATTITVASTSGFAPTGRFIVDSEVISYTNTTSTTFRGCTRGEEGTTAATHLTGATVTERDIIYTANVEPTELLDPNDQTLIPDPDVLVYGAAMELALGKLSNQTLHDRFKLKYAEAVEKLRNKFGKKQTATNYRIKDKDEVILDQGRYRNPNDYRTLT